MTTETKKFIIEYTQGYRIEDFPLELRDLVSNCYHMGECEPDVNKASHYFEVDNKEELKRYLKNYGWEDRELENDTDNLHRLLWLMSADIQETGEFIFSN